MKRLILLLPFAFAACQSAVPDAAYVQADRHTYNDLSPALARDAAAGHPSTLDAQSAWRIRLETAEKARGLTPATQP